MDFMFKWENWQLSEEVFQLSAGWAVWISSLKRINNFYAENNLTII